MGKISFIVTEKHIELLKRANVSWNDGEFGAPEIDPKHPYGNSDVLMDIAEIIGLGIFVDGDGEKHLNKDQENLCLKLHKEIETALQILVSNCHIEVGTYEAEEYDYDSWKKVS